jgi:hypothetical protein
MLAATEFTRGGAFVSAKNLAPQPMQASPLLSDFALWTLGKGVSGRYRGQEGADKSPKTIAEF